jgi:hypothetical protein
MLAILISNIYIVTLLASPFFSSHHVLAVDPVDELTRGIVYTAKDTVEKVSSLYTYVYLNFPIPN